MKTVQTRKAGAHPMPITTCASSSWPKPSAAAAISAPTIVSGEATSTVRRGPHTSMPMPMNSCSAPKEKWKAPANRPSCSGVSPNSCCSGGAMMAATVRKAWLSAKPQVSAMSMAQAVRPLTSGVVAWESKDNDCT